MDFWGWQFIFQTKMDYFCKPHWTARFNLLRDISATKSTQIFLRLHPYKYLPNNTETHRINIIFSGVEIKFKHSKKSAESKIYFRSDYWITWLALFNEDYKRFNVSWQNTFCYGTILSLLIAIGNEFEANWPFNSINITDSVYKFKFKVINSEIWINFLSNLIMAGWSWLQRGHDRLKVINKETLSGKLLYGISGYCGNFSAFYVIFIVLQGGFLESKRNSFKIC